MDELNERMQSDMNRRLISPTAKVVFSPRKSTDMLQWYADRLGEATSSVHYTAAFGIAQPIAEAFTRGHPFQRDDIPQPIQGLRRSPRILRQGNETNIPGLSLIRYVLLDSKPSKRSTEKAKQSAEKKGDDHYVDFYDIRSVKENKCAFGAILHDAGDEATNEECLTGLTTFVDFIHTKYMLVDALTDNPSVFTGSANFSAASTDKNDENMILIQGDTSVADIYVSEFMRLFDHFYSRDKHNDTVGRISSKERSPNWGNVVTDETWLHPYFDPSSQPYKERLLLR